MELFYSLLLGLVQGLTEFLPVSSSGHLILAGRILGYTPSVAFSICAHLGTLIAVVIAYRTQLWGLIKKPLSRPALALIFATIITAAGVFFFEDALRSTFDGRYLPYAFLATAILIVGSSLVKPRPVKEIGLFEGFIIGAAQAVAVIPGLSRSGTTIAAARFQGIDKKKSADFSFLLSVPIIIVSALGELIKHYDEFIGENVFCLLIGFAAAFVSGYLAIKLVLKAVRNTQFGGFAVYLTVLSVLLFANDTWLHLI